MLKDEYEMSHKATSYHLKLSDLKSSAKFDYLLLESHCLMRYVNGRRQNL